MSAERDPEVSGGGHGDDGDVDLGQLGDVGEDAWAPTRRRVRRGALDVRVHDADELDVLHRAEDPHVVAAHVACADDGCRSCPIRSSVSRTRVSAAP